MIPHHVVEVSMLVVKVPPKVRHLPRATNRRHKRRGRLRMLKPDEGTMLYQDCATVHISLDVNFAVLTCEITAASVA